MTRRIGLILAAIAVVGLTAVERPAAYAVISNGSWASGLTVPMYLQLGASPGALIDGATSWNDVAASAIAIWNRHLTSISFISRVEERGRVSGDGVNDVFFGDSISGNLLGPDVLALTTRWSRGDYRTDADVVFNSAKSWNSYRGPQRPGVVDFRRVALHAFGHGLGLTHPDTAGQSVAAVMNSSSHADGGSADDLQADDIAGARALYGGAPTPLVAAPARIARAETAEFRRVVEARYRDIGVALRRSFVEGQASAIWVSEYIWYRVSYCDHATATARVFAQAEGRGVQPVCAEPASNTAMPSGEDLMAFRASLEIEFRDVLKTAQSDSYIPANEEALVAGLYHRYRWFDGLTHGQALDRTADFVGPPLAPAPPAPAPGPAPSPAGYTVAISNIACGYVRTDVRFDPTSYYFTVTASGTASAPDVGGRVQFFLTRGGNGSFGLQTQLNCGAWSAEVDNDPLNDYAFCRRGAGQPATTTWSGTFAEHRETRRGIHPVELQASMFDGTSGTSRATERVAGTCTTP